MIVRMEVAGTLRTVQLEKQREARTGTYRVSLDGRDFEIEASLLRPGVLSLLVAGKSYRCVLEEDSTAPAIYTGGHRYQYRIEDPRSLTARRRGSASLATGGFSIKAPMPGRVVRIMAVEGDEVASKQGILVIEAMKMQNELKAPRAGRVISILVKPGATVVSGQALAVIE